MGEGKGFHLATVPPLDDYYFAQAEYVLTLIANSPLHNSTADEAAAYVATNPKLAQHPSADSAAGWLAGAYASEQWRVVLSKTIANGELVLFDRYSLLPVAIVSAEAMTGAPPAPAIKGIDKRKVQAAFQDIKWDYDHWGKNLATPPKWLMPCRVARGDKNTSSLWNPADIALALLDKKILRKRLAAVFVDLGDWANEWRDKTALERD